MLCPSSSPTITDDFIRSDQNHFTDQLSQSSREVGLEIDIDGPASDICMFHSDHFTKSNQCRNSRREHLLSQNAMCLITHDIQFNRLSWITFLYRLNQK